MVLKHVEDPYTADDFINQGYSQEEAIEAANYYNDGVRCDCVIEWQGQTFNVFELRDYINNNAKMVYNEKTVNMTEMTEEYPGAKIIELLGLASDRNGYHFHELVLAYKVFLEAKNGYGLNGDWPSGW